MAASTIFTEGLHSLREGAEPGEDLTAADLQAMLQLLQTCEDELYADINQMRLFGVYGFNLGLFELSRAKVKAALHRVRPRNPHQDDGRLIWRDHYSGLYLPVNYSFQFDLQWQLALEKSFGFSNESSTRLDDCAINDMIESTFGERSYLKGCVGEQREEHLQQERGISKRNFMLLNIDQYIGARVLDVGCGFGRWTAMMTKLGADVTSVDASPHAVKSTRRFNPNGTHQMSLFDLPQLPGFVDGWDFVICWGVMQHTHDPLTAFRTVASAVRDGGLLFIQVYSDQSKAAYPFTQKLRALFHEQKTTEDRIDFLRKTHKAAGADVFDHLDGMLTFYNWAVHEDTVRGWFMDAGFADYWKVWNYKYMGRKRATMPPVRDDGGHLLTEDLGEERSGIPYYPLILK